MKLKKIIAAAIITFSICLTLIQPVFADQFWDLYQKGEVRQQSGDILGAIDCWRAIIDLYTGDYSRDAIIKKAVYWTKIADAYKNMGWIGEAQIAYDNVWRHWDAIGESDSAWGPKRVSTKLKTDLNIYAKVPNTGNTTTAKYEPTAGIYFGAPFDKDSKVGNDLSKVESVYGKTHTGYLMYVRWGEPIQTWTANQAKQLGGILQIAWEPPADMSTIKYSEVSSFAKQLKDIGIPIFLRFACEMNEVSNAWSQNSPQVYKDKFKLVANTMHKEAPNVVLVWSPNYVPEEPTLDYYPGDEYVDWVGINAYTDRYFIGDPNTKELIEDLYFQGYYANPLDRYKYIYDNFADRKPIFIAETGVQNYAMNTGEDFSDWAANNMKRLYGYIPMVYPKIKAIFYFNVDSSLVPGLGLKQNYSLSRSQKVMDAYKEMISSPYYLSKAGNADFCYKPLEDVKLNKKTSIELSSYVKITDPFTSKVDYFIDGKKIGTSNKIPFAISTKIDTLKDGNHMLMVNAYDSKGNLSAKRYYTVKIEGDNASFTASDVKYVPKHKNFWDTGNHWAKDQINKLVGIWAIDGYDDASFKPEKQITKAEFYKLLSTSLGIGLESDTNTFVDVPYGHWAKQLFDGGAGLGILTSQSYESDGLGADQPITRYEMAIWTVRALNGGKDVVTTDTKFTDNDSIIQKYRGYITEAVKYGVIDGFEDGSFKPNNTATRAQAVSLVVRAVGYQNK